MLPQHRTSYDTALKHLYRKGLEKAIPLALRHAIPRTNISRWRAEPDDKYFGHSINHIAASELQLLQAFAESQAAKRAFRTWCKLALAFAAIFSAVPQFTAGLRAARSQIVHAVENAATSVSKQHILRFLGISRGTNQA